MGHLISVYIDLLFVKKKKMGVQAPVQEKYLQSPSTRV